MMAFDKETYERLVKEGKTPKIVTRDGDNVTIYLTNFPGGYPIVAKVDGIEEPETFCTDGTYNEDFDTDTGMDLFFADLEPESKYVPFYNRGEFFTIAKEHGFWMKRLIDDSIVWPVTFFSAGIPGYTYKELCDGFTWLDDGTPCGKKEE